MSIAELSIRKKVITITFIIILIGVGILSFKDLGRLEDPEFTIKNAQIITYYPGATPQQVEEEVSDQIETALQQLPQLKKVESTSKSGVSIVEVEIKDKYDKSTLPQVWDELRRKVNDVTPKLPPGVQKPIVYDDFGDVYGILFAVVGNDYSYRELESYADFIRKELLLVPDVAKVNIWGIQPQQVHVDISRVRLAQLGISLNTIYRTLVSQNLVVPSGAVKVGSDYIRIQPTGEFTSVKQIGDILLRGTRPGDSIYLKDVAKITRGYQTPPSTLIRQNSEKALVIGISIASGGNVVTMGDAIKKRLKELEQQTPAGIHLDIITFQSDGVITAINGFVVSLLEALAIVIGVLMLFMGFRSGLLIGFVLLITVLGTFVFMKMWGINLERISLGALIIALGMLVDNAIVVTEGILIKIKAGMERIQAAKEVVAQTALPLLGATVIAILAFAAIGLSQDSTGEYTRSLFQVILISLMLSWVIAVTITPLLCYFMLNVKKDAQQKDPYAGKLFTLYRGFLTACIRARWLTMAIVAILLAVAIYAFGLLENSFFPNSTRPQFMIHYWLPQGTDIRQTSKELEKLEKYVKERANVTSVATFVGSGAPRFVLTYTPEDKYSSYGLLLVNVDDYKKIDALIPEIQTYADKHFINAQVKIRKFVLGPSAEDTLEIRFSGPDPTVLRKLSGQAKAILRADGGATGINDDWRERVNIIKPVIAESQARQAGITRAQIMDALNMTFNGHQAGLYRERDKLLPILVRAPARERDDVYEINNTQVWSPIAQTMLPLRQIITGIETGWEDNIIERRNRKRTITTAASQKTGNASVVFARIKPKIEAIKLPIGYEQAFGGEYEDSVEAQTALFSKIPMTLGLVVLILIIMFNAIKQPLIIMLVVPLAIIGVSVGLLATAQPFGFMALLGFLSLSGMLIKNAIVLIDQINVEIAAGKPRFQAILDSSISRLRPVSMAAVTTVLGMIPLLFDIFFVGMAVTIMAGLSFATLLTMIIVPVLYAIFFKITYDERQGVTGS